MITVVTNHSFYTPTSLNKIKIECIFIKQINSWWYQSGGCCLHKGYLRSDALLVAVPICSETLDENTI